MASNPAINDNLLNTAFLVGDYSSKKETVNTALQEFIQRRKSEDLINLFGTVEYDADYDYKNLEQEIQNKIYHSRYFRLVKGSKLEQI